ncbi:MAG: minor capsid protein [Rhodobacter sp.]|nr:minor capsid protein [Rhodobacter sp.]
MSDLQQRADLTIRHQLQLERYKAGQAKKMQEMLDQLNEDVVARLEELNALIVAGQSKAFYTKKRFEKLNQGLKKLIDDGFVDIHATATKDNRELVDHEIEWSSDVLLADLDDVAVPTTRQVFAAVEEDPFAGWVEQGKRPMTYVNSSPLREVEDKYTRDMSRSIRSSYLSGATVRDAAKRLDKINQNIARTKKDYDVTRRNVESETRTAIQTYANASMEQTLLENGIKWTLYVATLDSRTTEICSALDGTRWSFEDETRPQIPAHWSCRSVYVPLFRKNEKLPGMRPQVTPGPTYQPGDKYLSNGKIRKARRGDGSLKRSDVSTDMDFNSWLSRQDRENPAFVIDYFGSRKKYDDWKAGKVGKVTYHDASGKAHTIDSLRYVSLGEGGKADLEMRRNAPAQYFMARGASKRVSKALSRWDAIPNAGKKLDAESEVLRRLQKDLIDSRIKNSKRLKIADDMLKGIEFVGKPGNASISNESVSQTFREAVALYGAKVRGIKRIEYTDELKASDINKGTMFLDQNASNVYRELGRFIAHNDKAYLEGSKYFSTTDIDSVIANAFKNFNNPDSILGLFKNEKDVYHFMFGIVDDKPKRLKTPVKPPTVPGTNQQLPIKNKDNALLASVEHNTLKYFVKLAERTPVVRQLAKLFDKKGKFLDLAQEIEDEEKIEVPGDLHAPKAALSAEALQIQEEVAALREKVNAQIQKTILDKRIKKRLPKFRRVANEELDGYLTTEQYGYKNLQGAQLQDAKNASAEAMALFNHRPATFRHLVGGGNRGSASAYGEFVNVSTGSKRTIYHEVAHHVEFSNPDIFKAAKDFVASKTTGKKTKLKTLYPNSGHEDWETVLEDEFIHPYVGKIYPDATEVISMGFEKFISSGSIVDFFEKDSEHFKLIYGILLEYDKLP